MIFSNIPTIEEDSLDHLRHENADLEEVFENLGDDSEGDESQEPSEHSFNSSSSE